MTENGEELLRSLRKFLVTKGDLSETVRLLKGELGGFKAEIYNHFHALENRLDSLTEGVREVYRLKREISTLKGRVEELERRLDRVEGRVRRIGSSILTLTVVSVVSALLLLAILVLLLTRPL